MKNWAFCAVTETCLAIILSSGLAHTQSNPLPLGEVKQPVRSVSCPGGFDSGTACFASTVSCPDTADIGFTYGIVNSGGKDGTVVFFSSGDGTSVAFSQYVQAYGPPAHDFQSVQVIWATPWEEKGTGTSSLKTAACRPATLMNWLLNERNVYNGGGMCAQGASAGSAAIAYSLAEYGASQYLNHVELESGPVLSDVSIGCDPDSSSITVCPGNECMTGQKGSWEDSPVYVDGNENAVSTWTGAFGQNACAAGNGISKSQYSAWKSMSIVDGITGRQGDSTFSYPKTSISGWLCSKPAGCNSSWCQNNSAAQGQLFYENVTTSKSVYRVDNCQSTEGVEEGTVPALNDETGLQAIIADMVSQCGTKHR
jgi:hypothetical protein